MTCVQTCADNFSACSGSVTTLCYQAVCDRTDWTLPPGNMTPRTKCRMALHHFELWMVPGMCGTICTVGHVQSKQTCAKPTYQGHALALQLKMPIMKEHRGIKILPYLDNRFLVQGVPPPETSPSGTHPPSEHTLQLSVSPWMWNYPSTEVNASYSSLQLRHS